MGVLIFGLIKGLLQIIKACQYTGEECREYPYVRVAGFVEAPRLCGVYASMFWLLRKPLTDLCLIHPFGNWSDFLPYHRHRLDPANNVEISDCR